MPDGRRISGPWRGAFGFEHTVYGKLELRISAILGLKVDTHEILDSLMELEGPNIEAIRSDLRCVRH